jgi:putative ABC transport system substrate-binding protein
MKRREFITLLGGAAAGWPFAARAQQPAMPVIGFLNSASPGPFAALVQAFRTGLGSTGHFEGQNVVIEYRWAQGQYDRLPALAAELVGLRVAVIAATGGDISGLAAKAATTKIPIVAVGSDLVKTGVVSSLNHSGSNVTGMSLFTNVLGPKRFGLLHELVPDASVLAVLVNPRNPNAETDIKELQEAGRSIGKEIVVFKASAPAEVEAAFATLAKQQGAALLVSGDPFFNSQQPQLIALTARYSIPAIYELRGFAMAGGLASYGSSITDAYRRAGVYTGQILKGAKPDDLPVMQPTTFELVINLKTAKVLGLTIPPGVLARADEVIE